MADIDQLSIQIESSTSGADKNLASLAKGLDKLQNALNRVDVSTFSSKMQSIADSVNTLSTSINGINPKNLENLATIVDKVGTHIDTVAKKTQKLNTAVDATKATDSMSKLADGAKKASDAINEAKMDGKMENVDAIRQTADAFHEMSAEAEKTSNVLGSVFDGFAKVYAFGGAVGKLAGGLDSAANSMNKFLVGLYSFDPEEGIKDFLRLPTKILPVLGLVEDKVKSKLSGVKSAFEDMGKTAMGVFNRMENFFAKIGQRFTFTLLRKAINAVIKDLNDAMVSLANFSGTTGREFNSAMSSMAASAKWLGASIVGAFAPLASAISPYIDALIEKLVYAIRIIGMFFAALTGKSTIAVANKGMQKFGASTEKAAKSAKKLESYLLGIDELNVFQKHEDNDTGGGGGAGNPYNWEEVDIPDWLKNLADKFKELLEKLFAPIKEAWNRTKNYVLSGLKYMLREIWDLIKAIGRDFLEMWNEEATIRMLENIFRIIGDIAYTVGNLAKRFREAWDEGRVGLHIFEHIRDIVATLIQHIRNVTKYMRDWSDTLNFRPLLNTFDELLVSLNKVADFIGGVFEDVMKNIVFKYIKWLIEEGIPHLNHTIKSIIDAFDFNKIRSDLVPLEEAIERLLETLETGFVNAMGNVGKALAEWTNSKEFTEFLEDIAGILNRITPERIEKFFTALGYAILDMIKALAKFVHSKPFQDFLDFIGNWFDKHSAKDLAKVISGIAGAIAGFKFIAFVGTGFKNFLQFIAIAKVADLGGGIKRLASAFSALDDPVSEAVNGTKSFFKNFQSVNSEIDVVTPKFSRLKGAFSDFNTHIENAGIKMSGLAKILVGVGAGIAEITLVSSAIKDLATGAENAGADIIKIIAGVGAAWLAFSMVFESTVVGAVIAGIVAAVAAVKGLCDAFEKIETQKMQDAFDGLVDKTSKSTHTLDDFTRAMDEAGASMREGFAQLADSAQIVEDNRYSLEKTVETISSIGYAMQSSRELTQHEVDQLGKSFEDLASQAEALINSSYDFIVNSMMADIAYLQSTGEWAKNEDYYLQLYADRLALVEQSRQGEIDSAKELTSKYQEASKEAANAREELAKAEEAFGDDPAALEPYVQKVEEAEERLNAVTFDSVLEWSGRAKTAKDEMKESLDGIVSDLDEFSSQSGESLNLAATGIDFNAENLDESFKALGKMLGDTVDGIKGYYTDMENVIKKDNDAVRQETEEAIGNTKLVGEERDRFIKEQRQLLEDHKNINNQKLKEYRGVMDTQLSGISSDVVRLMGVMASSMEEQGIDAEKIKANLQTFIDEVYGDGADSFQTKLKSAIDETESTVTPYGKDAAERIMSSMFDVSTVFVMTPGAIVPSTAVVTTLVDGWKGIFDEAVNEIDEPAKEIGDKGSVFIVEGFGKGMEDNADLLKPSVECLFKTLDLFIHDNSKMPFGSPNIKTQEYGLGLVEGLNKGIEDNMELTAPFIDAWMQSISDTMSQWVEKMAAEVFPNFLSIETWQPLFDTFLENVLGIHFEALKTWLDEKLLELVGVDFWQPYFDALMEEVFQVNFDNFRSWFTEDATTPWWEEDLLPWFEVDKWNTEIIEPVDETIRTHIEDFIKFWQDKIKKWFQDDVDPWFKKERWNTYGTNMKEGLFGGFKGVVSSIGGVMNGLIDIFNSAMKNIVNAINVLIDSFNSIASVLGLPSIGNLTAPSIPRITIPSFYQGGFTPYGNPSSYSLFAAGENGIPEMVGQVGGRPAVASNEEITGIRDAVYDSGYRQEELLRQIVHIATALLNKDPVLLGDREIAEANRRGESLLGMAIIS